MKRLLAALLITAAMALPLHAKVYKLPKEDTLCTINFPSEWTVKVEDESLDATSKDEEIYINIEVNDADSIEGAIEETFGYLKKNKVTVDKKTEKKTEGKLNGMDVVDFSWDGKDTDGATKISLTIVQVSAKKGLLILYWASPEGEKKHQAELDAIIKSLKKS
jgi:hypothetical protein